MIAPAQITAVILAGGRGRRMGGVEKGLLELRGRPLVSHVIERIAPQVGRIMISANRRIADYAALGSEVVIDRWPAFPGPLAGVASALAVTRTPYLLTVPCDTPWLPRDLVARLAAVLHDGAAVAALARGDGRTQPLCALLRCNLEPALCTYIEEGGAKAMQWWREQGAVEVEFSERDAFININTPEDRQAVEHIA